MSTLFVNNLNTASGSTITVPTGKKLVVTDTGGLAVPGTFNPPPSVTISFLLVGTVIVEPLAVFRLFTNRVLIPTPLVK